MLHRVNRALDRGRTITRNARDWLALDQELVQAGRTPYQVIHRDDIVSVRYYPPLTEDTIELDGATVPVTRDTHPVPLVIVSPLAVNMHIYDLFPRRSLVRYLLARGFRLYLVDWGTPTARHNHHHLDTYFGALLPKALEAVRAHGGSRRLSLHGWSFGGLFSYCHAARDADIANLVLVGAPVDYHANGELGRQYQRLARQLRWLERRTGFRVHGTRRRYWRARGWQNALAFKLTNPVNSVRSYLELIRRLDDREFVSLHATNAAFLDRMVDYPGGVVQDFIQYLWVDNVLARGELPSRRVAGRLADIHAPVLSIVGRQDIIVTEDCARPLLDLVASTDTTLLQVDGGHMGIVSGSRAARQSWPAIADWLAARSA